MEEIGWFESRKTSLRRFAFSYTCKVALKCIWTLKSQIKVGSCVKKMCLCYIYIYAFGWCFFPKWLHSNYFFFQFMHFLAIKPVTTVKATVIFLLK